MFDVSFSVAFIAGVVSFLAPCVVPLAPSYISYVTGVSLKDLALNNYGRYFKKILFSSVFYILGFSIVFVILGTTAAGIGVFLRKYNFIIQKVGGLIILLMGLQFAGYLSLELLAKEFRFSLPKWMDRFGYLRPFLIGVVFATSWTPCVGAVLGSILALAAVSGTVLKGAALLFVYSLGISLPFIIFSLTLMWVPLYLKIITKYTFAISRITGIFLAIMGLLLLTDTYKYLNGWLFEVAYKFGYVVR
ncbi:sulfite exporter TauE/SafE family protein [Candidatus Woesebacteria bacterium]|nr:sulfite exporter TauE/SafE family protein [Candidatus Woesebacteria bacterium]